MAHQTVSTPRRTAYDLCFTLLSRENYRTMLERMFPPAHAEDATLADSPEEIEISVPSICSTWNNTF